MTMPLFFAILSSLAFGLVGVYVYFYGDPDSNGRKHHAEQS